MDFDWKSTVKAVAPLVGGAIGGPFGAIATKVITSVLDIPEDSAEREIEAAVKRATPEQLLGLKKADHQFKIDMRELGIKEAELFANTTIAMEGTASDLRSLRYIGPLVIFARGCQRPAWGFATMLMDYKVFSSEWVIESGTKQDVAFFIINLLVLGFLFGERAIKNLSPLIEKLLKK